MKIVHYVLTTLLLTLAFTAQSQDRLIGNVLDEPVYESEVQGSTPQERAESLRKLLISPAIKSYLEPHKSEWSLDDAEITSLTDAFKAYAECRPELKLQPMEPPFDKVFANMIGGKAKVERFIYLRHGRGRVLFQQSGSEAFDATYNLVLQLEKHKKFEFLDQADRDLALSYWTRTDQSPLLDDPGSENAFQLDQLMAKCP